MAAMRSSAPCWLWLVVAVFSIPLEVVSQEPDRPNVIVIVSDDQGWADIGYHNPKVYSPRLDALAASGVTFTRHYVMPQCTPTRIALLTGRYPAASGAPGTIPCRSYGHL